MSASPRYVVGIDLGTTNCAVAYADITQASPEAGHTPDNVTGAVTDFAIAQLVAPGELSERPTLPSFLLLPTAHELAAEAMALPWNPEPGFATGTLARDRGAELPHRLVSSAKSWLSHTGVDRNAPVLPWRGAVSEDEGADDDDGTRVSPVEASARYLAHLCQAWDHGHPDAPLAKQEILLTVPASFDAVARELTVTAARQAGLKHVTLLEEPQAAFYSWLAQHTRAAGDDWRQTLGPGDVVLVCDIGGGTSDFSLIEVVDDGSGNLGLERIAVGEHILLGGDNIDLALAHLTTQKMGRKAKKLKTAQQRALVHACRRAKETLLDDEAPDKVPISLLGSGSKLIGGTIRTEVQRGDVVQLMEGGFFPGVTADAQPQIRRTAGLRELGLDYAADAAITRHLAAFLARHACQPTAILFNGGVMKSRFLRERLATIAGEWQGQGPLRVLGSRDLDLAVAHGAAYYGLVRHGRGIRIRGGTARAYYIGVESAMPAIPGFAPPIKALCVAPFGMEEGSSVDVPGEELGLVVGETAEFRFFASSQRKDDGAGEICDAPAAVDTDADADAELEDIDDAELRELDPVETTLPVTDSDSGHRAGDVVPVSLRAHVTEVGTLELWCVARYGKERWKLEYSVRDAE